MAWHRSFAWMPQASLTRSQMPTVEHVNLWLHNSRDHLVVPSRERPPEVFGNEKALDGLAGTADHVAVTLGVGYGHPCAGYRRWPATTCAGG